MATALARKDVTGLERDPFVKLAVAYIETYEEYGDAISRTSAVAKEMWADPDWPGCDSNKFIDSHRAEYPAGDDGVIKCYYAWRQAQTTLRRRHKIVPFEREENAAAKRHADVEKSIMAIDAGNSFFGAYAKLLVLCSSLQAPNGGKAKNLDWEESLIWDAAMALRGSMPGLPFFPENQKEGN